MTQRIKNHGRINRRSFFKNLAVAGGSFGLLGNGIFSQEAGGRPEKAEFMTVLNPRCRVPVGLIIDDSTCLVNLNRFAMPQFDAAFKGKNLAYKKDWRKWTIEIPDSFVRKFGEWCGENGVRGKYSVVPYPACVGRLDRVLPGWTQDELEASIELVRKLMMPNWDIHPEMVTHTRVIDLKTGHPYPEISLKYMENWDWTTGRSAEEIAEYMAYALNILKNIGFYCEGITTPGGFGNRARPQLARATLEAVRGVFKAEVPHYFRDLYDSGNASVSPRVELASGLDGDEPRCVVSIIGCTGDWTGGWDCSEPEGADKFIAPDLSSGRMVDVIAREEPAYMVCHWTGIYWNGEEKGFKVFQEVVKRLKSRFDNLIWMKLSDLARYWAAKELTSFERGNNFIKIKAPFACSEFTIKMKTNLQTPICINFEGKRENFVQAQSVKMLEANKWIREGENVILCFNLSKGDSVIEMKLG
ncbi:MAG: hypothetical protein N2487_00230 [Verrucomicrobiae bacterium]|nr:hypothetical protein [Verrucomicrobiae bacterium]